jgi:perosamine synthetase
MTDHPKPFLLDEVLWSGRGIAGLTAFLREAAPPASGVVVPVNLCAIAVASIIWSGLRPVFHDVSRLHGNAEIHHLDAVDASNCRVVLAVHNFGCSIDLAAFRAWADVRNMLLVEDVCNAIGATYQGRPLGQIGDAAFYSFNHGKIVACGYGGAISVRDHTLRKRVARAIDDMPPYTQAHAAAIERLESDLRTARISRSEKAQYAAFERYRAHALFRAAPVWPGSIMEEIGNLPSNLNHRRMLSDRYRRMISNQAVTHVPLGEEAAPWRYSIIVPPDRREALLTCLRANDIHASAWYPPVHGIFAPGTGAVYPEAERFAACVINFWVDTATDIAAVDRTSALVNRFFDEPAA